MKYLIVGAGLSGCTLARQIAEEGVYFVGRLANYKYYNMDTAILNALEIADEFTKNLKN